MNNFLQKRTLFTYLFTVPAAIILLNLLYELFLSGNHHYSSADYIISSLCFTILPTAALAVFSLRLYNTPYATHMFVVYFGASALLGIIYLFGCIQNVRYSGYNIFLCLLHLIGIVLCSLMTINCITGFVQKTLAYVFIGLTIITPTLELINHGSFWRCCSEIAIGITLILFVKNNNLRPLIRMKEVRNKARKLFSNKSALLALKNDLSFQIISKEEYTKDREEIIASL